jgi:hypothetical protein
MDSYKNLNVEELVKAMDECGIEKIVNIDGWPVFLKNIKEVLWINTQIDS